MRLLSLVCPVGPPEQTSEPEVARQVRRLDLKNDKRDRLAAVRWFEKHLKDEAVRQAVPALERSVKEDPDVDVRYWAVQCVAVIAYHRKEPCPLTVVEAMLDRDLQVRIIASAVAGLFNKFPPGARPILLRCMRSDDFEDRSGAVILLPLVGRRDEGVLRAVQRATRDKNFTVRHNARIALFKLTDKLDDIVPYCVSAQVELEAAREVPGESEEKKLERSRKWMIRLMCLIKIGQLLESRPGECGKLLTKLLRDPSPRTRKGAALTCELLARLARTNSSQTETKRDAVPEDAVKMCRPAVAVLRQKMGAVLKDLADHDPDRGVRDAARAALRELTPVQKSLPPRRRVGLAARDGGRMKARSG